MTDARREMARFCAAAHPLAPEILCGRLASVCDGRHSSAGEAAWTDLPTREGADRG